MVTRRATGALLLSVAVAAGCTLVAQAQTLESATPQPSSNWLARRIQPDQFWEQYLNQVMSPFRQADLDRDGLDAADLARIDSQRRTDERAQHVSQVLRYDLNGDLVVTPDEIASFQPRRGPEHPAFERGRPSDELERFDVNGDGRVTLQETLQASERISRTTRPYALRDIESLMQLPAASDGRLTAQELQDAARSAFANADLDRSGSISQEEYAKARASYLAERPMPSIPDIYCPMPPARADDLVVLLGAYEGRKAPAEKSGAATIDIEPGRQPIYLILSSYEPVRWTITGAVARVRQTVASTRSGTPFPTTVTGLPQQKVKVFSSRNCVPHISKSDGPEVQSAKAAVAARLERAVDVVAGTYTATDVSLPSARVSLRPAPTN